MKTAAHRKFLEEAARQRARVVSMRETKMTMQAIADKLGISRQRVNQILKKEAAK